MKFNLQIALAALLFTAGTSTVPKAQGNSNPTPDPLLLETPIDFAGNSPAVNQSESGSRRLWPGGIDLGFGESTFFKRHPIVIGFDDSTYISQRGVTAVATRIQLSAQISKNIKAVLTGALNELFSMSGNRFATPFHWGPFVEEAYIAIDQNEKGLPVVMLVGKRDVPVGIFENDLLIEQLALNKELSEYSGVVGVTLELAPKSLALIDSAIISAFESRQDDLPLSDIHSDIHSDINSGVRSAGQGASVNISKSLLGSRLKVVTSGSFIQPKTTYTANDLGLLQTRREIETRSAIGLVYRNEKDPNLFKVFGQVMEIKNNLIFPKGRFLYTLGGARKMGPGKLALTGNHLSEVKSEVIVSYTFQITDTLQAGPQITWTQCQRQSTMCKNGWSPMIVARERIGNILPAAKKQNCRAIGDPDCIPLGQGTTPPSETGIAPLRTADTPTEPTRFRYIPVQN